MAGIVGCWRPMAGLQWLVSVPRMISTRCLKVSQHLQETESVVAGVFWPVSNGRRSVPGVVGARPRRTFTSSLGPLGPTAGHRTPEGGLVGQIAVTARSPAAMNAVAIFGCGNFANAGQTCRKIKPCSPNTSTKRSLSGPT
jgi:hypothetical protein